MPAFSKLLSPALSLIVMINVIGLWLISVHQFKQIQSLTTNQTVFFEAASGIGAVSTPADSTPSGTVTKSGVSVALLEAIQSQVKDLQKENQNLQQQVKTLTDEVSVLRSASPAPGSAPTSSNVPKEYVIYLGSGNSNSTEWKQLSSAEYTFNPGLYPKIKALYFEASLSIIGGEARARLINKGNGAVISSSEVLHNSSTSTWVKSGELPIPTAEQTYAVQMRSSSGEVANMSGARLRVVVE